MGEGKGKEAKGSFSWLKFRVYKGHAMQKASTPDEYVRWVSSERRPQFAEMRQAIQQAMPNGFEEQMSYGMIGYVVPHELYPPGYHCNPQLPLPFVSIANQKNFFGFYHMGLYADAHLMDWFLAEHSALNLRKLDMGKSCIRFNRWNEIPLELLTKLVSKMSVEDWIACYEKNLKR
jgi:uncharacterized protein YdhG (YjbR/CyaY superfamily)